jgi:hypothetical protein
LQINMQITMKKDILYYTYYIIIYLVVRDRETTIFSYNGHHYNPYTA